MRYVLLLISLLIVAGASNARIEGAAINSRGVNPAMVPTPQDTLINPFRNRKGPDLRGKIIFEHNCAICHGLDGSGNGIAAPGQHPHPDTLTSDELHKISDGALFLIISNGAHGDMIPWKFVLDDDQRWHLVDYIREIRAKSH